MASSSPTPSDPVLVDHSTADVSDPSNATQNDDSSERPPPLTRQSTSALEKCWICLSGRDEDPPSPPNPPTAWRSPCKCTLQAHEACLLDWIADQEAPRSRGGGRSGPSPDKILCPQCREEIKVQRGIDPIVQLCRSVDRSYSRFVLPGLAGALTSTILSGFYVHGRAAVYLVCGEAHSREIFRYTLQQPSRALAYCLIPLNLIFARTGYADFVLPSGTLFLLSTQLESPYRFDWTTWPPLPSTAFACLPVVRQLYNWSYEKAFGELNRKWIQEVMPRREEGYEADQNIENILNEHAAEMAEAGDDEGGMVLELEVNLGAVQDQGGNDVREQVEQALNDAGEGEGGAPGQQNGNQNGGVPAGRVHQLLGDNELMDDTSSIGQLVLGSLVLPAVASGAGELLSYLLPKSWTSPAYNVYGSRRVGLLASKWGRSLVGGLAFVALKDMLVLYCRWRLAEGHKHRKIMNFDKQRKEYVNAQ